MKKAILNGYALNGYTVHSNLPIGAPMPWLSDNLPVGFLAFDGSEYNIADYPELYNVVKNIPSFHSDTEGKFKIPNLKGRVLQGADTVIGELIEAGLPNIIGHTDGFNATGGFAQSGGSQASATGWWGAGGQDFNARNGETKIDGTLKGADELHVYGNSDTVQPNAFTVRWIIKATQYATVEQNAIDDTRFTTGNVLSAQKTKELAEENYSTEEKIIGKWFDKNLYEKSFNVNNISTSSYVLSTELTRQNITPIKSNGYVQNNGGDWLSMGYGGNVSINCGTNNLVIASNNYTFSAIRFTIKYTKNNE